MGGDIQKISVVLLTFNRREYVEKSVTNNFATAGYPIHEVIWVDNGSTDGVRAFMSEFLDNLGVDTTRILNDENKGVAKGYNAGYKVAEGDIVVKPGTDMLLDDDWLLDMVEGMEIRPKAGIIGIYNEDLSRLGQRKMGEQKDGLIPARAIGVQSIRREVFDKVGYLPEEYGLYGWDDIEWDEMVREAGYETYYLAYQLADHMTYLDEEEYRDYTDFKRGETNKWS